MALVRTFFRAAAVSSVLLAAAVPAVAGDFCSDVKMLATLTKTRFEAVKGAQTGQDGDHVIYAAKIVLPGAEMCTVDQYPGPFGPASFFDCYYPTNSVIQDNDVPLEQIVLSPSDDNDMRIFRSFDQCYGGAITAHLVSNFPNAHFFETNDVGMPFRFAVGPAGHSVVPDPTAKSYFRFEIEQD